MNDAKLEKKNIEALAEKEQFLKKTAILEETISILKKRLEESAGSEKALKSQILMYSSKYGEFTKTFEGYKVLFQYKFYIICMRCLIMSLF